MNGDPNCHNSESIIIKMASIVVRSYINVFPNFSASLLMSIHQSSQKKTNKHAHLEGKSRAVGLTVSGCSRFFSLRLKHH